MDSNHTGETMISLGGREVTLVYDWRAISALNALLKGGDVFEALAGQDPDMLASIVAIGARRHQADVTAEVVADAAPPLFPTISTVVRALNRAFWGAEAQPSPDPPAPVGTTNPAGTGSPAG